MFKPDLGRSWLEHNDMSMVPTISPAPTYVRECDNVQNFHLDLCFSRKNAPKPTAAAYKYLGTVGQFSALLISFMVVTLYFSIFLSHARKRRKKGEGYLQFFNRDMTHKKKRKKGGNKLRGRQRDLEEPIIHEKGRCSKSETVKHGTSVSSSMHYTSNQSDKPRTMPSKTLSLDPSNKPSVNPSRKPSLEPYTIPSTAPSLEASAKLSYESAMQSFMPSFDPGIKPSFIPSIPPTRTPTNNPTEATTKTPAQAPTASPTFTPLMTLSVLLSFLANVKIIMSKKPTMEPTNTPTKEPS
eukprot:5854066-Ditylum_brightwellii.AAC.1